MRAKDRAIRHVLLDVSVSGVLQAQSKCPFCARIILGLDCTHPPDHFARPAEGSGAKVLIVEPMAGKV